MRKQYFRIFAEAIGFACFATIVCDMICITYNGLTTGFYGATVLTNAFGEHWIELPILLIAFALYFITFKDKLKYYLDRRD